MTLPISFAVLLLSGALLAGCNIVTASSYIPVSRHHDVGSFVKPSSRHDDHVMIATLLRDLRDTSETEPPVDYTIAASPQFSPPAQTTFSPVQLEHYRGQADLYCIGPRCLDNVLTGDVNIIINHQTRTLSFDHIMLIGAQGTSLRGGITFDYRDPLMATGITSDLKLFDQFGDIMILGESPAIFTLPDHAIAGQAAFQLRDSTNNVIFDFTSVILPNQP